jgi:hypothetical protein
LAGVLDAAGGGPRFGRSGSGPGAALQGIPEFKDASYAKRYEVLLTKLVRERLYDAACFLISSAEDGVRGVYREPAPELSFENFVTSLVAKAIAVARTRE